MPAGRAQLRPADRARVDARTAGDGGLNQPSREDGVVEGLSEVVGGPVGEHARPHPWWTPVRVLLAVFTVVFAAGLLQKYPCGSTNWADEGVRYRAMCYSDVPYLYTGRGFAEHRWPYGEDDGRYPAMEYPVVISYVAWAASGITALMPSGPSQEVRAESTTGALWGLPGMAKEVNTYFLVTAVLMFLFGLGAVFFLAGASPGRPWDAMGVALSPLLLVGALVNWDLVAVFFTAGALWAWTRGKPGLAGVMVGLGFAAKLYPLFLLGAFLVDAVRRRRPDRFAAAIVAGTAAWVVVNLPALLGNADAWRTFWTFNSDRGADLGSFWLVLAQRGHVLSAHTINVVSGVLFVLACAGIFVLGLAVRRRPQVAQVAFLVVAAFLLVNKVYSPQYMLWLLPLAVLARPRWRDQLIWQTTELIYFAAVWFYLGGWLAPSSGTESTAYHLAILIRMAGEIFLVVMVVRDMVTAEPDLDEALEDLDDDELRDVYGVDVGGREPDPDLDGLADLGRGRP